MKKYNKVLMNTAILWSTLSSCKRKQVGAIISKNSRILSNGYNGTVSGADNCCEEITGTELKCTRCGCKDQLKLSFNQNNSLSNEFGNFCRSCNYTGYVKIINVLRTKNTVVHAEANAILSAAMEGISLKGCDIYVTLSPCVECSKLIIQSGITNVYYNESYKGDLGAKFLKENGITVAQI